MGPPLRFTREVPTERLRGEPRRCGRCGGLSYKNWETTSARAHSPHRGDATHRHRPEKRTPTSTEGIWVHGCDWRTSQDVPDRGGAPNNGECLQGKTGTSVVDVPTEGCPTPPATPGLSEQTDRWTDGWTDWSLSNCGLQQWLIPSWLFQFMSDFEMETKKKLNNCLWRSRGRLESSISEGGGSRWCRFQLFGPNLAVCPGAAVLHLTHVTEKMSPHAPGCLNLKVPPKDSSDSYSGLNPLKWLVLTLSIMKWQRNVLFAWKSVFLYISVAH